MIERFKYTSMICTECGNPIVMDIFKEEFYCLKCGLITITEHNNENNTH